MVGTVAPAASFIPGVGPIATAALTAGGKALGTLNNKGASLGDAIKNAAVGGLTGYATGYGIDKLQGAAAANGGGIGGFLKGLTSGPGIPGVGGLPGTTPGTQSGGILGQLGSFLTHNPELALGGIAALSNARQASGSADLRNQAVQMAMSDYNDRKPFRDLALQRLQTLGQSPSLPPLPVDANPYAHAGVGRI